MRRLSYIILGLFLAAGGSAIATGTAPVGLPWVTAQRQTKIKTNPASSAAADASLLLDSSSAGAGECMIGVDTATDVCLIDAEGDAAAASMAVAGTSSAATLSAATALTLEETGAGTDAITLQAPASITAPYTLTLPPGGGAAGECLQNTGTPGVLDFGACAPAAGDITAVGSMTSGAAFADSGATGDCLGLTADCSGVTAAARIDFTDSTVDIIGVRDANLQIGTGAGNVTAVGYQTNIAKSGDAATLAEWTFSNTGTDRSIIAFERARGTAASPSALSAGDGIGEFVFNCYTDSRQECAKFKATAATGFGASGTDAPANFGFYTTPDGSGTALERLTILSDGKVGVGDTTPAALFTVGTSDAFQVDASGNATTSGDVAVNGGDLTTTSSTMNLIPSAATAINIGTTTSADINIGDSSSTVDFGDTASAATAFLPDADAGADLGTSAKHFRAAYFNQEFTGPVHRCTADANCTVATTDRYVFMNEQASQRYVILPAANISGQTISIMTGNNSGAVTVTVCTQQDANCGSTGTDVIDSSNTTTFGTPTNTQRTSIGNGRRYISDGAGVWIELPTL